MKTLKAAAVAASAGVMALGLAAMQAGDTFSSWADNTIFMPITLSSGSLDYTMDSDEITWSYAAEDVSEYVIPEDIVDDYIIVPGGTVTGRQTITLDITGDTLVAKFMVSPISTQITDGSYSYRVLRADGSEFIGDTPFGVEATREGLSASDSGEYTIAVSAVYPTSMIAKDAQSPNRPTSNLSHINVTLAQVGLGTTVGQVVGAEGWKGWYKTSVMTPGPEMIANTSFDVTSSKTGVTISDISEIPLSGKRITLDDRILAELTADGVNSVAIPVTVTGQASGPQVMDWRIPRSASTGDFATLEARLLLNTAQCTADVTEVSVSGVVSIDTLSKTPTQNLIPAAQNDSITANSCLVLTKPVGWAAEKVSYKGEATGTVDFDLNGDGVVDSNDSVSASSELEASIVPGASEVDGAATIDVVPNRTVVRQ